MNFKRFTVALTTVSVAGFFVAGCDTHKAKDKAGAAKAEPGAGSAAGTPPTAGVNPTPTPAVGTPAAGTPTAAATPPTPTAVIAPTAVAAGASGDCAAVADHVIDLSKARIAALPEAQRKQFQEQLPIARKQVIQSCAVWPAALRKCMLGAKGEEDLKKCSDLAPKPEDLPDPSIKLGGPACPAIADKVSAIMMKSPNIPADKRAEAKAQLPMLKASIVQQCKGTQWPKSLRTCLSKANVEADLQACQQAAVGGVKK